MDKQTITNYVRKQVHWLFDESPTRPVELLSGLTAFFFSVIMMVEYHIIVLQDSYINFGKITSKWLWIVVLIFSIMQIIEACKNHLISNLRSAQIALWFTLVWFIIALLFASNYPPLSTGFFTYTLLAFTNFIIYVYLEDENQIT